MLVSEAMKNFRYILHDVSGEYDDRACLLRLNHAAHYVAHALAAMSSPLVATEETLTEGGSVPDGFLRTCGSYPLRLTGTGVHFLDGSKEMSVRFFREPAPLTDATEEMPFPLASLNDFTVRLAAMYALNRNEFDVSQDKGLLDELAALAKSALGGGS